MNSNILIVEDDSIGRMLLRRILKEDPAFAITEAKDGLAAWQMLEEGPPPDLCILDIMMPRMDGLDLLMRIRAAHRLRPLKVIMCTAVNDRPRVFTANSLEIDGYILKPFTAKKVLDTVRQALRHEGAPPLRDLNSLPDPQGSEWSAYVNSLQTLSQETAQSLDSLREALATGDRTAAMEQAEAMKTAGQKLGLAALMGAANRLGVAILLDDTRNIAAGMQTVESARQEVAAVLAKFSRPVLAAAPAS